VKVFKREAADECLNGEIFYSLKEGADRDREMASAVQHEKAAQRAGLQAACPRGLQPLGSKFKFTADGCDIKLSHFPWTNYPGRSASTELTVLMTSEGSQHLSFVCPLVLEDCIRVPGSQMLFSSCRRSVDSPAQPTR